MTIVYFCLQPCPSKLQAGTWLVGHHRQFIIPQAIVDAQAHDRFVYRLSRTSDKRPLLTNMDS